MSDRSAAATNSAATGNLLLVAFVVLKLCGVIDWSWWWVLAPLWGSVLLLIVAAVILLVIRRCA